MASDSITRPAPEPQATIEIIKVSQVRPTAATIEAAVTVVINGVTYQATHHLRVYADDQD
jgi:hypothetical protein